MARRGAGTRGKLNLAGSRRVGGALKISREREGKGKRSRELDSQRATEPNRDRDEDTSEE